MLARLIASLLATFFVSRLLVRRRVEGSRTWALVAVHATSLAIVVGLLLVLRLPNGGFYWQDYAALPATQFFWLCIDGLRRALFRGWQGSNRPRST